MIVNNSKGTLDTIWMQKNLRLMWVGYELDELLNREGFSKPQHQRTFDIIYWMYIAG